MPHLLLIQCPDERGLVYKITGVLYAHGLVRLVGLDFPERFMRPVPTRLQTAFAQLGYAEPDKETELLLLLIEALWKIEANQPDEHVRDMLEFIKRKYGPQGR